MLRGALYSAILRGRDNWRTAPLGAFGGMKAINFEAASSVNMGTGAETTLSDGSVHSARKAWATPMVIVASQAHHTNANVNHGTDGSDPGGYGPYGS